MISGCRRIGRRGFRDAAELQHLNWEQNLDPGLCYTCLGQRALTAGMLPRSAAPQDTGCDAMPTYLAEAELAIKTPLSAETATQALRAYACGQFMLSRRLVCWWNASESALLQHLAAGDWSLSPA